MSDPALTQLLRLREPAFVVRMDKRKIVAYLVKVDGVPWEFTEEAFGELIGAIREGGFKEVDVKGLCGAMPDVLKSKTFCIARGTEPVDGKDGSIEYAFDANPAGTLWEAEDGQKMDFRRSRDINNVKADQVLARVIPPCPGTDGQDVFGQIAAARRGRQAVIVAGGNVRLSEDGQEAYAEIDGYVQRVRSRVLVHRRKVVKGDVDFRSRNVDFNGDVIILGDVKETFNVAALGGITVAGSVDRANLKAGGDITVQGGVYGKEGIEVKAEGDVYLGFAENANIKAGGNLYVRNFMVNCCAEAGDRVHLKAIGKSLIGGHVKAAHGVVANSLGNPRFPTETVIEFGVTPEMERLVRSLTMELQRADELRSLEIRRQLEEIEDEYSLQQRARVAARHITYPGVVFISAKASYEVRHEINGITFYKVRDKNEISMRAFGEKDTNSAEQTDS